MVSSLCGRAKRVINRSAGRPPAARTTTQFSGPASSPGEGSRNLREPVSESLPLTSSIPTLPSSQPDLQRHSCPSNRQDAMSRVIEEGDHLRPGVSETSRKFVDGVAHGRECGVLDEIRGESERTQHFSNQARVSDGIGKRLRAVARIADQQGETPLAAGGRAGRNQQQFVCARHCGRRAVVVPKGSARHRSLGWKG